MGAAARTAAARAVRALNAKSRCWSKPLQGSRSSWTTVCGSPGAGKIASTSSCLPDVNLLIDLDPAWSHGKSGSLERDAAKTRAALWAGLRLERVRERGLSLLQIPGLA